MNRVTVQRNQKDTIFRMLFKEKENLLMLYEHQSTVNPNMPLRDWFYVADVLQGIVRDKNLYGRSLVKIPAPKFIVFYNGADFQPEQQMLRLSDAFEKQLTIVFIVNDITNCTFRLLQTPYTQAFARPKWQFLMSLTIEWDPTGFPTEESCGGDSCEYL